MQYFLPWRYGRNHLALRKSFSDFDSFEFCVCWGLDGRSQLYLLHSCQIDVFAFCEIVSCFAKKWYWTYLLLPLVYDKRQLVFPGQSLKEKPQDHNLSLEDRFEENKSNCDLICRKRVAHSRWSYIWDGRTKQVSKKEIKKEKESRKKLNFAHKRLLRGFSVVEIFLWFHLDVKVVSHLFLGAIVIFILDKSNFILCMTVTRQKLVGVRGL